MRSNAREVLKNSSQNFARLHVTIPNAHLIDARAHQPLYHRSFPVVEKSSYFWHFKTEDRVPAFDSPLL
jgi:hypothetical protein